jgi:hypothetical protein
MTLVTIISKDRGFIPLLYHFKDKVTTHILIYDIGEEEIEIALDTKEGLEKLANLYSIDYKIKLMPLDEDSKKDFSRIFNKLEQFDNLALNVAEADSLLVIMLSSFVMRMNGKVFSYDKFDNTFNVIYKSDCKLEKAKSMKLIDYLTLLNYEIESKKTACDIVKYKDGVLELFKNYPVFINQRRALQQKNLRSSYYKKLFQQAGVIKKNKINIQRLNGELFEEYVFWNLFQLDVDDMWLNVKVISEKENNEVIKNEFDILMIKNNRIYVVECKFGKLAMKPDELIYKLDSLLSIFGESSKGIIIYINDAKRSLENIKTMPIQEDFKKKKILRLKKQIISKNLYVRALENNILILYDEKPNFKKFFVELKKEIGLKRRAFLIGGCDLEMAGIVRMLKRYNQIYFNKYLSWGAKLSNYKEEIKKDYCFYGIELVTDITPPKCYKVIDHHNEYINNISSIEQVAEILGIELSRFEKLIALNDRGYIPLMREFGASEREIRHVRYLDRKFQGVTDKDEKEAIKAIEGLKEINGIKVFYTKSERFSPICDRINFDEYIIYNGKEAVYYGDKIEKIVKNLKNENIYYAKGFVGVLGADALNKLLFAL